MNYLNNSGLLIWCLVSTLITIWHTIDEVDGRIWEYLHQPEWAYYTFQAAILLLGLSMWVHPALALVMVAVRIIDAVGTHYVVGAPGWRTAIWLLLDAAVILVLMG